MPRKRPPARSDSSQVPPAAVLHKAALEPWTVLSLAVLGLLILIELALFFGDSPAQHVQRRIASLIFLVAPDELFTMWCGGQLANFSLFDRAPLVLLTLTVLAGAWLAGRLALRGLRLNRILTRLERHVFALGVGLNLMSLYALAIGLSGGLQNRWLFILPLVALLIANLLAGSKPAPGEAETGTGPDGESLAVHRDQVWSRLRSDDSPHWLWWLLAAAPFALVIVLGAMLPPWAYDVREYHLQAPKEWYLNGRIAFLPHNIYANMPLGAELTSLWAMALHGGQDAWWWGAMAGKTIMACYSLIAAATLIAFGLRLHSLALGVIAAVLYLSNPWVPSIAITGYNEGPVALYALLAILALWLARQQDRQSAASPKVDRRVPSAIGPASRPSILSTANQNADEPSHSAATRLVALSGFCAGSAVACKYPPMLFLVVPLFVWIAGIIVWIAVHWSFEFVWSLVIGHWSFANRDWIKFKQVLLRNAIFLVATTAACGLWFAKNWALTNNPTYPLLYSAFDGKTRTPEKHAQWQRVHSPQPDSRGRRYTLSSIASELAWNAWRNPWASLALPLLVCAAWLAREQRRFLLAMGLFSAFVFLSWWLLTHRLDRFLMLLMPLAALVAAIGVFAIDHRAWRTTALGFVAVSLLIQFPLVALHPDNRYFAPLDRLRRDDRDLGEVGVRVEAAHRWLNTHGQPGEKVLLVGDAEPFDLEIRAVYNTCFDDCQFTRLFQNRTRAERLAALKDEKIAYVFFSWAHLDRYRSPGNYGYTSDYPQRELVHQELVADQKLLIPIDLDTESPSGELYRVAAE